MARSFSNAKLLSAFVVDRLSVVATRRGYAAASASQGVESSGSSVRGGIGRSQMMMKKGEEPAKSQSWIPDPVTGYYRPENKANEVDVAELREMLLTRKINNRS
ncbi:protein SENESCENCE-ASSOCIATED GENE 21, mitochondrial-like [Cornus florida]|uniref:protein SENESCENCE-ASSOCIATED GENE 21, mitochondrial-like n=1 Tax=Cornus florida TaxID=4283 RepID=UPI00289D806C|nr:protein SENESCENCE-ASSOCIATED GENE 21, mitochondrial-like [Cornus florida]